jgi:hypothetical protein
MATQAERRRWREAVERALNDRDHAERYELRQRELRRGRRSGGNGVETPELDGRGIPIPQPIPRFMQRVGRLINGA